MDSGKIYNEAKRLATGLRNEIAPGVCLQVYASFSALDDYAGEAFRIVLINGDASLHECVEFKDDNVAGALVTLTEKWNAAKAKKLAKEAEASAAERTADADFEAIIKSSDADEKEPE